VRSGTVRSRAIRQWSGGSEKSSIVRSGAVRSRIVRSRVVKGREE
jgi:hypothetical protein